MISGNFWESLRGRARSAKPDDLERWILHSVSGDARGRAEFQSDEQMASHLFAGDFSRKGNTTLGRVVYTVPGAHWYRVQLDDLDGDLPCCSVVETGLTPISTRSSVPIPPFSQVLVWVPINALFGIIIGVVPEIQADDLMFPDWIQQGSNVGMRRHAYYYSLPSLTASKGGFLDFAHGRPADSLAIGEWSRFTTLGGGLHLDPFLLFFRLNEACGLWMFYMDSLLRLSGHNMDIRTAMSEQVVRDDSLEGICYTGWSPYTWEAMGTFSPNDPSVQTRTDEEVHYSSPYGKIEPAAEDQRGFYRTEEYRGYLGQGFLRQVIAPPASYAGVWRLSSTTLTPGLFREQIGLDGSLLLASAHSLSFVKRIILPAPKRIADPESGLGDKLADSDGTYLFAGRNGSGPEHKVGDVATGTDESGSKRVAGLSDILAHALEWKALHPFHYHSKDFHVPEQAAYTNAVIQQPPDFASLRTEQDLPRPSPKRILIDHRSGNGAIEYFETEAGIFITPEGHVVIRAGGGEQIVLGGGSIRLTCPGDVVVQPGRSSITYAGDDIIIRANKSVDITTSTNDIHIKAERNLELLGGNNGQPGHVLIENQSESGQAQVGHVGEDIIGGGVLIKSRKAPIAAMGAEIYLRTGGGDVQEGDIVIDAGRGRRNIRTLCDSFIRHIRNGAFDTFPVEGQKSVVNVVSASAAVFGTGGRFEGPMTISQDRNTGASGMTIEGHIAVVGGNVGTELAETLDGKLGALKGKSLQQAKETLTSVSNDNAQLRRSFQADYENAIRRRYYAENNQLGNDDFLQALSFSLRTPTQMHTDDHQIFEAYWQQIQREVASRGPTWEEPPVVYQNVEYAPHPGLANWTSKPTLLTLPLKLHDAKTGRDAPRSSGKYESPELSEWTPVTPAEGYFITPAD